MLKGKNFLLKRVISCVLVCAMILGLIPQSVYAAPSEGTDTQKTYSSDGFTITYKEASAWDNYVNAEITLANDTDSAKSLWEIQFSYDGEIDSIWNADIKNHDDGTYVLEAKTYNSTIAAGQSVTLGFMAHGSSAKPAMLESITFADASASEDKKDEDTEGGDSEGTGGPGKVERTKLRSVHIRRFKSVALYGKYKYKRFSPYKSGFLLSGQQHKDRRSA